MNLFSDARLASEWPDVRILWSARYPWKLPAAMNQAVKGFELFVDLPNNETRRSQFELSLKQELYRNLAATLDEMDSLSRERASKQEQLRRVNLAAATADPAAVPAFAARGAALQSDIDALTASLTETRKGEPDDSLYAIETQLRNAVAARYRQLTAQWKSAVLVPLPYKVMAYAIGDVPAASKLLDDYMAAMKPVIDFLVNVTGMSLGGYCQLQNEHRLTFSEVDMFLSTTGRRTDKGLGLTGATPYGFTIEDIVRFQDTELRKTVNTRLLRAAIDKSKAFVFGSQQWASPGCQWTARAVQSQALNQKIDASDFNLAAWLARPENNVEVGTCSVALGPDLRDLSTKMPVIPLSARFGSHRLLKEDAMRALTLFLPRVTPKPDYPRFVTYVLFGKPQQDRPPLNPNEVSAVCRAQPGPVARLLEMSGATPVARSPISGTTSLSPFSLVFANASPTIKFGGGGGGAAPNPPRPRRRPTRAPRPVRRRSPH